MFTNTKINLRFFSDIDKVDDILKILEAKQLRLNFATLKELSNHYLNVNDVQNVEKIFVLIKESDMELLNRHVLQAILKLSTSSKDTKYRSLLHHLTADDEFYRAISEFIPQFVKYHRSTLVAEILGVVNNDIAAAAKLLFKEMAVQQCSADEFNRTWRKFEEICFYMNSNINAYSPALYGQSSDLIKKILKTMYTKSTEKLRPSHFTQLLKLAADRNTSQLMDTLNLMCSTYKVRPRHEYIGTQILPLLRRTMTYPDALSKLRRTNIRFVDCILATVICLLNENDMLGAFNIATQNSAYLAKNYVIQPLQNAYRNTNDVDQFVQFVHLITERITAENLYHLSGRRTEYTELDVVKARDEFLGRIIRITMNDQKSNVDENIRLLRRFLQEGISISSKQADIIRVRLKVERSSDMDTLLEELTTMNLEKIKLGD